MSDETDDGTIGIPGRFNPGQQPPKIPDRKKDPLPPQSLRESRPVPPPRNEWAPGLPLPPSSPADFDDAGVTIPPPRPSNKPKNPVAQPRPTSPRVAPASRSGPESEPARGPIPQANPSEVSNWGQNFFVPPDSTESEWNEPALKADDFERADASPKGSGPPSELDIPGAASAFGLPWQTNGLDPRPIPIAPRAEHPRPSLTGSDPKTPQGFQESRPATPRPRPSKIPAPPRDEFQTVVGRPGDIEDFEVPRKVLMLHYSFGKGSWRPLEQIREGKHVVGRATFGHDSAAVEYLAADHLRIFTEDNRVSIEEGETLNGVYLKVPSGGSIELESGTCFLIGDYVIEFQVPELTGIHEKTISRDREKRCCCRLEALGYLVFQSPDNGPGIRFPLTRPEGTILGSEGEIALRGGEVPVSRRHARVVCQEGRYTLEDLHSTNGTFVRIAGPTPLKPGNDLHKVAGDVLRIGTVHLRVVEI